MSDLDMESNCKCTDEFKPDLEIRFEKLHLCGLAPYTPTDAQLLVKMAEKLYFDLMLSRQLYNCLYVGISNTGVKIRPLVEITRW